MRARRPARPARAAAIALAVVAASLAAGAARADDPGTLRRQAAQLEARNAALSSSEANVLLDLYALESSLGRAERRLAGLQARSVGLERQAAEARSRLTLARRDNARAERALGARLRALYIEGDVDPLAVLLGAESLDEAISALDGLGRLAEEDRRIVDELTKARASLRLALRRLSERQAEVRRLVADARAARDALTAARSERARFLTGLVRERAVNAEDIAGLVSRAEASEALAAELAGHQDASESGGTSGGTVTGPAPAPAQPVPLAGAGRTLTVSATGYCLRGTTATGIPTAWGVVAVDPGVIPLGTRMTVPGYGEGVAADTGGAVRGAVIDLWFPSCAQARAWGRRTVTITLH